MTFNNLAVSVTYSRKKGMFNRDKLKLYLKINCDTTPEGVWKVKERLVKKYNLTEASFTDVYPGPPPSFGKSEISKRGPRKKTVAMMEKVAKKLKKAEKQKKKGELIIIFMKFKLGGGMRSGLKINGFILYAPRAGPSQFLPA